jgi:hypothetical protein
MKKTILILLLSVSGFCAYSQTFHLNLGTSLSKLDWNYIYQEGNEQQYHDPLLGYALSTGVEYLEHKYYSVSSDLSFYKSGGKYSSEELNSNFVFESPSKISVSYLSLSSSFNVNPINNKFRLQLSAGPRIDYIIGGVKKDPYAWIDERDGLNKLNYGINMGIGLYYNLDKYIFGINSQYLLRMRKLADLQPSLNPGLSFGGVRASEQIFLLGFSLGYHIQ